MPISWPIDKISLTSDLFPNNYQFLPEWVKLYVIDYYKTMNLPQYPNYLEMQVVRVYTRNPNMKFEKAIP